MKTIETFEMDLGLSGVSLARFYELSDSDKTKIYARYLQNNSNYISRIRFMGWIYRSDIYERIKRKSRG